MSALELFAMLGPGIKIKLSEPCDCGDHIRHNNGGNYHQIIDLESESGAFYKRSYDTADFKDIPEWEEISYKELMDTLRGALEDNYEIEIIENT